MGIIKEIYPQCDYCYETNPDMLSHSVKELKNRMKGDKWIIKSDGLCYCSKECYEKGYFK